MTIQIDGLDDCPVLIGLKDTALGVQLCVVTPDGGDSESHALAVAKWLHANQREVCIRALGIVPERKPVLLGADGKRLN